MYQYFFFGLFFSVFLLNSCSSNNRNYVKSEEEIYGEEIVEQYHSNRDYKKGVQYVLDNYPNFENNYRVNYLLGEMGLEGEKWNASKVGYERTIELVNPERNRDIHYTIHNNDNTYYWNSLDGLGVVYYKLGDYKKALKSLEKANDWIDYVNNSSKDKGKHYFNLACAYSLNGKAKKSVEALENAINYNSKYRNSAKYDSDFDPIRDEQVFQNFLQYY